MSGTARRPLVAGNWKLNHGIDAGVGLARALRNQLAGPQDCEVVVAPVFTALAAVAKALEGSRIGVAAQDCHWENSGAFTGEVGPYFLTDAGCSYAIVGHSERRQFFGESDQIVQKKTRALLAAGLRPIVCVGELLEQREAGQALPVVEAQLRAAIDGLTPGEFGEVVVAYEPVWAIGTGRTASPTDAQEVHAFIRALVRRLLGDPAADSLRILYGGSVKAGNAASLMAQADIDGALVGGASLKANSFLPIVAAAHRQG